MCSSVRKSIDTSQSLPRSGVLALLLLLRR
jgi:hypothetical protein